MSTGQGWLDERSEGTESVPVVLPSDLKEAQISL